MSLILPRKCPILGCKHSNKLVYADRMQMKNHILYDHDYLEKLESAKNLGIISDIIEHRSALKLAESLTDFSLVGDGN